MSDSKEELVSVPRPNDDRNGLRRCRDCGVWKPVEDFHTSPRRPSGRGSYCQPCFNERSKASYAKRVKEKHGREVRPPRRVPLGHRYCPDCEAVKPLAEFPRNRSGFGGHGGYCEPCHNRRGREAKQRLYGGNRQYHLIRRYGIGQEEFDELLAEQGGVCAICGAESPEHVDHDHETGYIRGILCFNCNGGLGQFRDNETYLRHAIGYLSATASRRQVHPGFYQVLSPLRGRRPRSAGARAQVRSHAGGTLPLT